MIETLRLTNFRCFSTFEIDFHPDLTVIVAQNGGGKTAILDALSVAFGTFVGGFAEGRGSHFTQSDVRLHRVRLTASNEMEPQYPLTLEASGRIAGHDPSWKRELRTPKSHTTVQDAKELSDLARKYQDRVRIGDSITLPLIAYYGTGRLWKEKRLTESRRALSSPSRLAGYADCLDPSSTYRAFADWFRYAVIADFEHKLKAAQKGREVEPSEFSLLLDSVREAVNHALSISGWGKLDYSAARQAMVASHPEFGELAVDQLSDGIRNMIGMVADIAFRMARLNPHLGREAARETPGLVLIDEVDMHLHPEWQQVVLRDLRRAFPLVQFIITTHSPQVLTTVRPEQIRRIEWTGDQAKVGIPRFSLGAESNRVMRDIQGVEARPDSVEIVHKLKRYQALIENRQWRTPEALSLRQELDAWGHEYEPELTRLDMDIRLREYSSNHEKHP